MIVPVLDDVVEGSTDLYPFTVLFKFLWQNVSGGLGLTAQHLVQQEDTGISVKLHVTAKTMKFATGSKDAYQWVHLYVFF